MVALPLAVLVGLKDPQLAGVQLQVTPPLAESLETVAVNCAVWPPVTEVGGLLIATEMLAGGGLLFLLDVLPPQPGKKTRTAPINAIKSVSRLIFITALLPWEGATVCCQNVCVSFVANYYPR